MSIQAALRAFLTICCCLTAVACGSGSGSAVGGDQSDFFVLESNPSHNATRVSRTQIVLVRFNHAISPASISDQGIVVTAAGLGGMAGTVSLLEGGEGDTLQWLPSELLAPATEHSIRLSPELRSIDGAPLGTTNLIAFRTSSASGIDLPRAEQLRQTAGMLNRGRMGHTGTLLNDGRVLIVGGFTQGNAVTDSVEVYSSASDAYGELPEGLNDNRAQHTATKLTNGRILVTGGWFTTGSGGITAQATAEIFNPSTNSWTAVGDMTHPRADHAAILLPGGKVLITGGSNRTPNLIDFDDGEIYDPATETFTALPNVMNAYRGTHQMFLMDDSRVIILGGSESSLAPEVYDINTQEFTSLNVPELERPRIGAAMVQFESLGVFVGGGDGNARTIYSYPDTGFTQNTGSALTRARSYATATLIGPGMALVAGGIDFGNGGGFVEASIDLVVEGGIGGSRTYGTDVRLGTGMASHVAVALSNGDVLFCGGVNEDGSAPHKAASFLFELD